MKFLKKTVVMALAAALLILTISGTAFAATTTVTTTTVVTAEINQMALALNKLNILQGDSNGNLLLTNKINRAEAATLIVRMLGKKNFVEQNKEQLKVTKFPDVAQSDWFAPYVGYCEQNGIMTGLPDGRFAPKDYVTEKAFIKMAVSALGYEYNKDFDWTNVYQKAFVTGVVTDKAYSTKTTDNTNYLRADAVKVLYNALNAQKNGTTTKLVLTLVNDGLFVREQVAASGILGADKPTAIDMVTTTAINGIEINLNENIQSVNPSDISILDASTTGTALAVQSAAFSGDKVQVITAGQIPGKIYNVTIRSVTDTNGYTVGPISASFTGFTRQAVTSDYFKISKLEQAASNVVNVYFTQPVSATSETPAFYELVKNGATFVAGTTNNITVKKLQSVNNAVSLYFKSATLEQGEVYTVKVGGKLASSYGVKLAEGAGESMDFVTTVQANAALAVSSVQAWSATSVQVIFNRDVDPGWAEKYLNYTVYDANKTAIAVTKAVISGTGVNSGRTVLLSLASALDKTKSYELRMEYVPDIYKQSIIEAKSFPFGGAYPENTALAITQTSSDYNNCVTLVFNKALDPDAAVVTSTYTIQGVTDGTFSTVPVKAYYEEANSQYFVKLFLPSGKTFTSPQRYKVIATGLKDSLGTSQILLQSEFTGGASSIVRPQAYDAVTVSKDAIKILFNIEISPEYKNVQTSNFTLEYKENGETIKTEPIGVTYVDARTLVLRFDALDFGKQYTVRYASITDYSGIYSRTAEVGGNTIAVRYGK